MVLYFDDIFLAANDLDIIHETKKFIAKNFEIKDMGEASHVIGIKIFRDKLRGLLRLSQKAYIKKVLEKFNMNKYSPRVVPI